MKTEFKVTPNYRTGQGYAISIGIGRLFEAKDLKEVNKALEHYFKGGHRLNKKNCPLCRGVRNEVKESN